MLSKSTVEKGVNNYHVPTSNQKEQTIIDTEAFRELWGHLSGTFIHFSQIKVILSGTNIRVRQFI